MGADVFAKHAWLLAANPTLFTDVLPTAPAAHIHILLIGFVPKKNGETTITKITNVFLFVCFCL